MATGRRASSIRGVGEPHSAVVRLHAGCKRSASSQRPNAGYGQQRSALAPTPTSNVQHSGKDDAKRTEGRVHHLERYISLARQFSVESYCVARLHLLPPDRGDTPLAHAGLPKASFRWHWALGSDGQRCVDTAGPTAHADSDPPPHLFARDGAAGAGRSTEA